MLNAYNLSKSFGALKVIRGVSFHLNKGARHALIGPNGAGKTTIFNLLSGELPPDSGSIALGGKDITSHDRHKRVQAGIARSFQRNNLFEEMSVLNNIFLALLGRRGPVPNLWRMLESETVLREKAIAVAAEVGLGDILEQSVGDLSYGSQRQLELGLVLALSPKVMLLDEPTAGMSLGERTLMLSIIENLSEELALLIIEHDMDAVFQISNWMTVLDEGEILFEGTPDDVRKSEEVQSKYFSERG